MTIESANDDSLISYVLVVSEAVLNKKVGQKIPPHILSVLSDLATTALQRGELPAHVSHPRKTLLLHMEYPNHEQRLHV